MKAKVPKKTAEASFGTLYEFNKLAVKANEKPLLEEEINNLKPEIENWFNWAVDSYAMILCKERSDYTLFHLYMDKTHPNPPHNAAEILIEMLQNRGEILSIEKSTDSDTTFEIWLKIDDEPYVYYLFPYDKGVIEC